MDETRLVNDCPECDAFDKRTKALVSEFLSTDECALITLLLAGTIQGRSIELQKVGRDDARRFAVQKERDFAAQVLGKFLISFEDEFQAFVSGRIKKTFGLAFNIRHEPCPHKAESRK